VLFGRSFRMEAELSQQYARNQQGEAAMFDAGIQTGRVVTMHNESGPYSVIAQKINRAERTKTFTPPSGSDTASGRLESWHNGFEDGVTRLIRSDSELPVNVSVVEFVVDVEPRSA